MTHGSQKLRFCGIRLFRPGLRRLQVLLENYFLGYVGIRADKSAARKGRLPIFHDVAVRQYVLMAFAMRRAEDIKRLLRKFGVLWTGVLEMVLDQCFEILSNSDRVGGKPKYL